LFEGIGIGLIGNADRFFPVRPSDAPNEGEELFQHELNLLNAQDQATKVRRIKRL